MKVSIFGELNVFELFILSSVLPAVFVYLWTLITGDIKVREYVTRSAFIKI